MKPLEFLADVLPPAGMGAYCVVGILNQRRTHFFTDDLSAVKATIKHWVQQHRDVYFALSVFDPVVYTRKTKRRTAENARAVKALFIDMDGYETKRSAAQALGAFLDSTGLSRFGRPHVIDSGGGLHCYWPLTKAATIEEWQPIAEMFKRLCRQEKLEIDMTVTADSARILRVPSTFNHKPKYPEPRPVRLMIQSSGPVELMDFSAHVRALLREENLPLTAMVKTSALTLEGVRPGRPSSQRSETIEAILQNTATSFKTIWLRSEAGTGCAQLQHYRQNARRDNLEPIWRGLLSWTKVCADGREYAELLTDAHPYDRKRMEQKLSEIKGPYPCAKMDSENPGLCKTCLHWGRITNPLALGREVKTSSEERVFELPLQMATSVGSDDYRDDDGLTSEEDEAAIPMNKRVRMTARGAPPRGFEYGEEDHSGVFAKIREKDPSGTVIETQVQVLSHDLFVVDLLRMDNNEHHVHMTAIKAVGAKGAANKNIEYTQIILPSKTIVAKDELLKCLASHNVYAAHGEVTDKLLYRYVRACVENAATTQSAIEVPTQFGWQKDRSFVFNNRIFRPDGTVLSTPMPGLENLNRNTGSKGTLEGWRKPWELLIKRRMDTMLALCVDAFGSPLMHFSDQEGFVWHMGSTQSGTGKSLALSLKAGVWGHPIRYRTGKGTSPVAMQQRAGLLNSLPLLIDEITSKSRADLEWAPAFVFDISEGQGKERMESGTNRERINNTVWALTCTMTSNTHMGDVMTSGRAHSSHGELMRMLEWNPSEELHFDDDERKILKELRRNYGVAAEVWVSYLVTNYKTVRDVWTKVHARLRTEMQFTDEERYWHAACTCTITAAVLLGQKYANVLTLPIQRLITALQELVDNSRRTYRRSARSAEDVLNAYIRDNYGKFVVVRADAHGEFLAEFGGGVDRMSTHGVVMGRIEHGTMKPGYVEFYVEEHLLRRHCAAMSFGYADFRQQMLAMKRQEYAARFGVTKDLLSRVPGPSLRVSAMHLSVSKEHLDAAMGKVPLGKA